MNEVISLALSNDREFVIHTVFQAFGPFDYFVPGLSVCLFFFISARIYPELHVLSLSIFASVTHGRGSVFLCRRCDTLHILPVLWMTSYLHIIGPHAGVPVMLQPARLGLARPWLKQQAVSP